MFNATLPGAAPGSVPSAPKPAAPAQKLWKAYDDILAEGLHYIEERAKGNIESLLTQWPSFNSIGLNGLEWHSLYVIAARPGVGKALSLDTKIPTPTGWTTMGDLKVGDYVLGMDGKPTKVTFVTETMTNRQCFKVLFSDDTEVIADAEHLWFTETRASRRASTPPKGFVRQHTGNDQRWKNEKPGIKNTLEIKQTLRTGPDNRLNHSVPVTKALELPEALLPIDPYVLGYWLGDGDRHDSVISVSPEDIPSLVEKLKNAGYYYTTRIDKRNLGRVRFSAAPISKGGKVDGSSSREMLRKANLLYNKHIPQIYLRASKRQRLELIKGLMDSDGTARNHGSGRVSFAITNKKLFDDVKELVSSMGFQCHVQTKQVKGKNSESSVSYTLGFVADIPVFELERKRLRQNLKARSTVKRRYITDIIPVESVPVRCITVDNDDHMYLVTESFISTHNTLIANAITRNLHALNKKQDFNILHFQFEMLGRNMALRELSAGTNLNIRYLQSAKDPGMPPLTKTDHEKLLHYVASQRGRKEYVIDRALTVEGIKKAIYDFYAAHRKPFVITLDHTLLVKMSSSETSKMVTLQNLATMMTEVKKDLPVIFLILTQMNREIDDAARQEPGKLANYPTEADVYGSDYLLQCADVMIAYNRPAKYNLSQYGPNRYLITPLDKFLLAQHVLKNRFGDVGINWYRAEYATMNVVEAKVPSTAPAFSAAKK
jgi:replicative DNA helicase